MRKWAYPGVQQEELKEDMLKTLRIAIVQTISCWIDSKYKYGIVTVLSKQHCFILLPDICYLQTNQT
jgi:hypothetical protein